MKALTRIFTGKAGGSTGLLKILVGSFLGVRTEKIIYEIKDGTPSSRSRRSSRAWSSRCAARTRARMS